MESVQERMKRLGTKEKIASFIQKEKQPYNFKRRYAQIRAYSILRWFERFWMGGKHVLGELSNCRKV